MERLVVRYLWTSPHRCHSPGMVVWNHTGHVVQVGGAGRHRPVRDLALFPGLVNAHVHLQLPPLPRPVRRFLPWIRAVGRQREALKGTGQAAAARRHLVELVAAGCTGVAEIDALGTSPVILAQAGIAGRCFQELLGYHMGPVAAAAELAARRVPGHRAAPPGWSPHGPHSASPALLRAAVATGLPCTVHVAESEEEQEFLLTGKGPFRDLLAEVGRLSRRRAVGRGAVEHLDRLGVLGPRTSLVHCQHLLAGDAETICARGAAIVVCPGTMMWFRRPPVPVPRWRLLGIPVALGTDSAASNARLDMVAEMGHARRMWPDLAPREVLAMATTGGASALARPALGSLRRGGRADMVAVRPPGAAPPEAVLEGFTAGELPVAGTWLRGHRRDPASSH